MIDAAKLQIRPEQGLAVRTAAWLAGPGRDVADARTLLEALSAALVGFGVPLVRATTHAPTLHPSYR